MKYFFYINPWFYNMEIIKKINNNNDIIFLCTFGMFLNLLFLVGLVKSYILKK